MKKRIFILIGLVFLIGLMASPALAETDFRHNVCEGQINTLPDTLNPEDLEKLNKEDAKKYEDLLKKIEKQEADIQWTYPVTKNLGVPRHKQETTYWCGPASVLAVIDYNGKYNAVSGSTEYDKQKTLATETGTTTNGAYTPSLRNALNDYLNLGYAVSSVSSSSHYDRLWNIINGNINSYSQPVIVLLDTSYLPYYNNKSVLHYVVVEGLTKQVQDSTGEVIKSQSTVRIMDPSYDSKYYGYRTVLFDDLFKAARGYFNKGSQAYNIIY